MKKNNIFNLKHLVTIVVCSVILLSIITAILMNASVVDIETDNDWIGFYAAIFGGLISGGLTLAGVVLTIRDGKEALKAELVSSNRPIISLHNDTDSSPINEYAYDFASTEQGRVTPDRAIYCVIENLGNGALLNLEIICLDNHYGAFNMEASRNKSKTINIDNSKFKRIRFRVNSRDSKEYNMDIKYQDIFGNVLKQKFCINFSTDNIEEIR